MCGEEHKGSSYRPVKTTELFRERSTNALNHAQKRVKLARLYVKRLDHEK